MRLEYEKYLINQSCACRQALERIDNNKVKILFIVDDGHHLVASLTDGDIRRFLLSGGGLSDEVKKAGNINPAYASDFKQAQDLYNYKNFIAIPIINNGVVVDIFFGNDGKRVYKRIDNVSVVINAGGKGTRLAPYTNVLPKPLIPVGDMPIIEIIMKEYMRYGLSSFSVITNYKKELLKAYFSESDNKYSINWYDEDKPLGTGGGLSLLKGDIKSTFFFANCDCLLTSDYESMLRYHKEHHNSITMVCAYKNIVIPYGVIELGENGSIANMREKPELSFLTNTGMYIVEPDVLDIIDADIFIGFPDIIKKAGELGKTVGVYPISENEWMDMGQLDELEKMRKRLYGQ